MQTLSRITVRMPADLHAALVRLAEEESRTLNGQIVYLLRQAVRAHPRERPAAPSEGDADTE